MARTKKLTKQEQYDNMLNQFREVADKRNLREETVLETFEVSYQKAIAKRHGGEGVNVKVSLNRIALEFDVYIYKTVVENDEAITDDAVQITLENARLLDENIQVGEEVVIFHDYLNNLSPEIGRHGYQNFLQRLVELEKEQLYEIYKDKIGEMILGTIETSKNNRMTYANIGQTSVPLDEKQLINGERFAEGAIVPFYVVDVVSDPKGAKIILSRTDDGFVKGLLTKEVHEIYDGTVVVHDIVREPGERCKISVSAKDENVDPVGACIGPGGQRIQKVSAELGPTGRKEKIDIIPFSNNMGIYIMEAFRPAIPLGIVMDEKNKTARVVFDMGDKGKALGQKGANVRLAKRLTGYDLVIMELDEANTAGLVYKDKEQLVFEQNLADQDKAWQTIRDKQLAALDKIEIEIEDEVVAAEPGALVTETAAAPVAEVEAVAAPKPEVKVEEVAPVLEKVKTTISLADLEKELEEEKARPVQTIKRYKPRKDKEEEIAVVTPEGPKMQIYTEEELRVLEGQQKEDESEVFDDIDFEAFDEYYDE